MTLGTFLVVSVLLFLLLETLVLPWMRANYLRQEGFVAIERGSVLAALSFLSTAALVSLFTSLAVYGLITWLLHRPEGLSLPEFSALRDTLQWWQSKLAFITPVWAFLGLLAVVVGMTMLAYRRAKLKLEQARDLIMHGEVSRLLAEREAGKWKDLPPSESMLRMAAIVIELDADLKELDGSSLPIHQRALRKSELEKAIESLTHEYIKYDLVRRIQLDFKPADQVAPPPRNWRDRAQVFLCSRGLLETIGGGARALVLASVALVVPCLIGIQAPNANASLEQRRIQLNDLVVGSHSIEQLVERVAKLNDRKDADDGKEHSEIIAQGDEEVEQSESRWKATWAHVQELVAAHSESAADLNNELAAQSAEATKTQECLQALINDISTKTASKQLTAEQVAEWQEAAKAEQDVGKRQDELNRAAKELQGEVETTAKTARELGEQSLDSIKNKMVAAHESAEKSRASIGQEIDRVRDQLAQIPEHKSWENDRQALTEKIAALKQQWQEKTAAASQQHASLLAKIETATASRSAKCKRLDAETARLETAAKEVQVRQALLRETAEQFAVQLARAEAQMEWQRARSAAPAVANSVVSAADRVVMDRMAQVFEREIVRSNLVPELSRLDPQVARQLEVHDVRNAILQQSNERAPQPLALHPTMANSPGLTPEQSVVLQEFQRAVAEPNAVHTDAGKKFRADLQQVAETQPELWEKMKAKGIENLAAGQTSSATEQFQAHLLHRALDGSDPEVRQEWLQTEQARRARTLTALADADTPGKSAFHSAANDPPGKRTTTTASERQYREFVQRGLPGPLKADRDVLSKALLHVQENPGTIDTPARPNPPSVEEIVDSYKRFSGSEKLALRGVAPVVRAGDGLVEYQDHFPGQLRAEPSTPRARYDQDFRNWMRRDPPTGYNPPPAPIPRPTKPTPSGAAAPTRSLASFRRARSFSSLRGFSRIGGVLIGRPPEKDGDSAKRNDSLQAADLHDLGWQFDGDRVKLFVVDAEGKRHSAGEHSRQLVEQAIAYAADGRPTTVTMVTTEALPDLRILLHPLLVDTRLGYAAIELDRFVDKYTGTASWRRDLEGSVSLQQKTLYQFAWSQRLLALLPLLSPEIRNRGDLRDKIEMAIAFERSATLSSAALASLLGNRTLLEDKDRCVLTAKPDYFDEQLVNWILQEAKAQPEEAEAAGQVVAEFGERIRRRTERLLGADFAAVQKQWKDFDWFGEMVREFNKEVERANDSGSPDALTIRRLARKRQEIEDLKSSFETLESRFISVLRRSLLDPTDFVVWSGVRERPFDARLDAVLPSGESDEEPAVSFMLQVAFTTPPYFQNGKSPESEEDYANLEEANDAQPWQFWAIDKKLHESVLEDLSPEDAAILHRMNQFTRLQRFFRLSLDGHLGKTFPVRKLVRLHREAGVDERQPIFRTPRWNVRPDLQLLILEQRWLLLSALLLPESRQNSPPMDADREPGQEKPAADKPASTAPVSPVGAAAREISRLIDEAKEHCNDWLKQRENFKASPQTDAKDRERLRMKLYVVPVLVGGAQLPKPGDLPSDLLELLENQAIPITSGSDCDSQIAELAQVIRSKVRGRWHIAATLTASVALSVLLLRYHRPSETPVPVVKPPGPTKTSSPIKPIVIDIHGIDKVIEQPAVSDGTSDKGRGDVDLAKAPDSEIFSYREIAAYHLTRRTMQEALRCAEMAIRATEELPGLADNARVVHLLENSLLKAEILFENLAFRGAEESLKNARQYADVITDNGNKEEASKKCECLIAHFTMAVAQNAKNGTFTLADKFRIRRLVRDTPLGAAYEDLQKLKRECSEDAESLLLLCECAIRCAIELGEVKSEGRFCQLAVSLLGECKRRVNLARLASSADIYLLQGHFGIDIGFTSNCEPKQPRNGIAKIN